MNGRRSLRFQFTMAALVPLLLAIAAAWAVATFVFTRMLEQRVEQQLENTADVLTGRGLPLTPELLQRVADLQQARITLLDAQGRVVASTQGGADAGPTLEIVRPLAAGSDPRAASVRVTGSLRDARDAARRAALGMGLAVLAAAVLLVILQYLLVRGLTRPISRLVDVAHGIAGGRRDVRADAGAQGELEALAGALNEMTARLSAYEAELAERSRLAALGEMSARIAHEVRNPLTGMKLHLELLDERLPATDRPVVRRLLDEVGRLELIVASSLSLTRADAPSNRREADLVAAVEEVLQLMEPSLRHRGIELGRRLEPLPPLAIDRDRIKQAVLNLVVNAADAMPQGGVLLAGSGHDAGSGTVTVSIEDSGPGFDPGAGDDDGARTTSRKPFGLGLGLRVCREIAAEHGGRLELGRSEALGGARAMLVLPTRAADGASG